MAITATTRGRIEAIQLEGTTRGLNYEAEDIAHVLIDEDVAAGEYEGCSSELELAWCEYVGIAHEVLMRKLQEEIASRHGGIWASGRQAASRDPGKQPVAAMTAWTSTRSDEPTLPVAPRERGLRERRGGAPPTQGRSDKP